MIAVLSPARPCINNTTAHNAPSQDEIRITIRAPGKPVNAPISAASFISPPPMPPREIRAIKRNMRPKPIAPKSDCLIPMVAKPRPKPNKSPVKLKVSGIIPSLMSVKALATRMAVNTTPLSVCIENSHFRKTSIQRIGVIISTSKY